MDISYSIDTNKLDAIFLALVGQDGLNAITAGLAANARDMWLQLAGARLTTSRRDYIDGLQAIQMDRNKALIALVGAFPNIIEQGTDGFDLRDTLLRQFGLSSRVIPFRHRTPGSAGTTGVGKPLGRAYQSMLGDEGARKLGKQIYDQAKRLKPGQALDAGLAPKLKSSHATDLYAGLERFSSPTGKGQSTKYMTFRTISENSPPGSWLYPARPGMHLMDQVANALPDIAGRIIESVLDGIIGKGTP